MQKVIRAARSMGLTVKSTSVAAAGAVGLMAAGAANAALPAALTAALTALETDIGLFETAIWAVVIAGALVFFYIKMGKRGIKSI